MTKSQLKLHTSMLWLKSLRTLKKKRWAEVFPSGAYTVVAVYLYEVFKICSVPGRNPVEVVGRRGRHRSLNICVDRRARRKVPVRHAIWHAV